MRAAGLKQSKGGGARVGCALDIDFRKVDVPDGQSFMERSVYGHLCTNHGAVWNLEGMKFDGSDDFVEMGTASLTAGASSLSVRMKPQTASDKAIGEVKLDNEGFILYQTNSIAIIFGSRGGKQVTSLNNSLPMNLESVVTFVYTGGDKDLGSSYEVIINAEKQTVTVGGTVGGSFGKNYIARENGGAYFPGQIKQFTVYDLADYAAKILQRAIRSKRN